MSREASRVVCLVQARMGSSRLPGKSLRALHGTPIIEHVLQRARAIPGVNDVVLVTSKTERDQPLAAFVYNTLGFSVIEGSEHDVLERYAVAAEAYQADVIMRVTGDCPFLAPDVAAEVLQHFIADQVGSPFFDNDTTSSGFPDGTDVEVFSRQLLELAHSNAVGQMDREHVTRWMRRVACTGTMKSETDWSHVKLSVDTASDYAFAERVMARISTGDYRLATTMKAVAEVLA